jgi:glucosamine-6-phosphate deaminase
MIVEVIGSKKELENVRPFHIGHLLWGTRSIPKTYGYLGFVPDEGFCLKMVCEEKEPLRTYENFLDPVYRDSAMEAFFQFEPERGGRESSIYLNFEVNANGALLAAYGSGRTYRTYFSKEELDAFGCTAKVEEKRWSFSLCIPLRILEDVYGPLKLGRGSRFTCNFYKISESKQIEHYASCFPIRSEIPSFHVPEYFGEAWIGGCSHGDTHLLYFPHSGVNIKERNDNQEEFFMKIYKAADYKEMSRKAANIIASQVIMKPDCVLGLATGSTPIGTYERLVELYEEGDLDFSDVKTVNLDEYKGLPRTNDQSYYYFMHDNLFDKVNIDPANTNLPDGMEPDSDQECARYEDLIRSLGGVDLQLLGLGHNGHIGFNEPADAFDKETHCVDLQESTIEANKRFFASADEVPKQAYTMGIGTIMRAKKILIVVSGEDKADIVAKAFFGPVTPAVPASILQMHGDVTLVADAAALSKIPE